MVENKPVPGALGALATPEELANDKLNLGVYDIWALGITIVIGGQYFSWNAGYSAGFGSYLISTILIGLSYIFLCLGNAEISSALPFAGGAYGLARVALGMYPGFIVGCLEAAEYIIYVATSAVSLSLMIIEITNTSIDMLPVYCLAFYVSALLIHIPGGFFFWRSNSVLAIVSIALLLMYIFGSIKYCDFSAYALSPNVSGSGADRNEWFAGGFVPFLATTPLAAWFYVGVESLNLGAAFVKEPKRVIGRGSIACILTLFVTSIAVLFVCASLPPLPAVDDYVGLTPLAMDLNPLNVGYIRMFNFSSNMATIISIPATYATAFGFIFAYGRVITAMARSSLFPPVFAKTYGPYETPYIAFITGSVIGYACCILVYFVPIVSTYLFNICILSGFLAYISQMVGFILFRFRHSAQERLFVSPAGIPGAVFGITVFSLSAISVMVLQNDGHVALITVLISIIFYSIYYFAYAKKKQRFSPEEKFIFVQQIVKFNERARLMATRGTLAKRPKAFRVQPESYKNSSWSTSKVYADAHPEGNTGTCSIDGSIGYNSPSYRDTNSCRQNHIDLKKLSESIEENGLPFHMVPVIKGDIEQGTSSLNPLPLDTSLPMNAIPSAFGVCSQGHPMVINVFTTVENTNSNTNENTQENSRVNSNDDLDCMEGFRNSNESIGPLPPHGLPPHDIHSNTNEGQIMSI